MNKYYFLFCLDKKKNEIEKYCKLLLENDKKINSTRSQLSILPTFLFHGFPGTGKTTLANQIYSSLKQEYNIDLKYLQLESILSHNFGESSKNLKVFFQELKEEIEENDSFSFVILDELDSFAGARLLNNNESIKRVLLTFNTIIDEMIRDKTINKVIIIATTNLKESLDTSVLRRFFFHKNFNQTLSKEKFQIYLNHLLKIGSLEEFLNQEEKSKLYELYIEKKMTIGEFKSIFAHYYMAQQIKKTKNNLLKYITDNNSFYEIMKSQIEKEKN